MTKILLSTLLGASFVVGASTAVADSGTISFQGDITQSACSIGGGQQGADMIVKMGSISTNMFSGVGSKGPETNFTIALIGCDPTVSTAAAIAFRPGAGSVISNRLLGLENGSGAKGVAVGLVTEDGTAINVGGAGVSYGLVKGTNNFKFKAFYEAIEKEVAGGKANAQALFEVQYS
ncbi:fimbrial protein [Achromobacter sp. JUb104]|uniref:fimbrial protein n=1 Tax=Achromobacter sp. JUb104 TaxID=2940590 RepID=UPI0021681B8C|nr:fimbrial protein [Achromobacter sp. JUb104]MCS3509265.1 major type 1 subunit fimbrin (pilin) [Achromobacter sp. JUb104]